jgi:hypothetical protein
MFKTINSADYHYNVGLFGFSPTDPIIAAVPFDPINDWIPPQKRLVNPPTADHLLADNAGESVNVPQRLLEIRFDPEHKIVRRASRLFSAKRRKLVFTRIFLAP